MIVFGWAVYTSQQEHMEVPGLAACNLQVICLPLRALLRWLFFSRLLPGGFATLSGSAMPEATSGLGRSKLREPAPRRKIDVKREPPVGGVSVFTLIRTDTTLDHSQKAEKV